MEGPAVPKGARFPNLCNGAWRYSRRDIAHAFPHTETLHCKGRFPVAMGVRKESQPGEVACELKVWFVHGHNPCPVLGHKVRSASQKRDLFKSIFSVIVCGAL